MAISSLSSTQSYSAVAFQQLQRQQAQRNADQAEQAARSLQAQARTAQSVANQAQENARSVSSEANQAGLRADQAQRGLASSKSISDLQSGFDSLRQQISAVLSTDLSTAKPVESSAVPNSSGQQTGTIINVTA